MFNIVLWTQFSTDTPYVMHCLLHILAYSGHYQEHTCFYIHPLFMSAIPRYTSQCLHIGSVLFGCIIYVMPVCYKMY
jgi:hypothetical protein